MEKNKIEKISERKFMAYYRCQMSGVTNMFDVNRVMSITRLTRDEIVDIMKNYECYKQRFIATINLFDERNS